MESSKQPITSDDIDIEKNEKVGMCMCSGMRASGDLSDDSGVTTDDASITLASTQDDSQLSTISDLDIAHARCFAENVAPNGTDAAAQKLLSEEPKQDSSDSNFVDDTDSQQSTSSSLGTVSLRKILKRRCGESGRKLF